MRNIWVPAVNATGRFGRWDFVELQGAPYDASGVIIRMIARSGEAELLGG